VALSFGLRHAIHSRPLDVGFFFTRCYASATGILRIAKDEMAPLGILNHAPNSFFVAISYAAVSLLRYNRPKFRSMHNYESTILELVQLTGDMLDKQSGRLPGQYAAFLRSLIHYHSLAVSDSIVGVASSQSNCQDDRTIPALVAQDEQTVRQRAHAALQPVPVNGPNGTAIPDGSFDQLWDALLLPGFGMLDQARETGYVCMFQSREPQVADISSDGGSGRICWPAGGIGGIGCFRRLCLIKISS
jgi:hypothetical protein